MTVDVNRVSEDRLAKYKLRDRGEEFSLSWDAMTTMMGHGLLVCENGAYRLSTVAEMEGDPGSVGVNHQSALAVLAVVREALLSRRSPSLSGGEVGASDHAGLTVRAHKPTCANVQPGSTIVDKCDCGALDTAGNSIPLHPKEAEVTVTEEMAKGLFEWACDDLLPAYGIEASRFDSELAEACRVGLVAALSRKG